MLKRYTKYILVSLALTSLIGIRGVSQGISSFQQPGNQFFPTEPDSVEQFNIQRVTHPTEISKPTEEEKPSTIPQPENINYRAEYDPATGLVNLYKMVGNIPVKLPYTMTVEEYRKEEMRQSMLNYWDSKRTEDQANERKGGIQIGAGKAIESIFGSSTINIRPQGIAELQVGVTHTRIDNPTLQERMRKTTTFDFQEKIQMNITGNIGDKLKMGINYNTEASFDFENQINLEYTGHEDEILQKVEAGNVTLPLPGTLITGSQSLFGVKTEMQFGRLTVTSIFSQQKGETSTLDIQGGAQQQDFEIGADEYDKNRHFFLSHYFRDRYNDAMKNLPIINSSVNITKIEVWITNTSSDFDDSRNIIAFADLGENSSNLANPGLWTGQLNAAPSNDANSLYQQMSSTYSAIRDINQVTTSLSSLSSQGFRSGREYEKIENARLLDESEYTLHPKLGYISLNSQLNDDEILAVAYEYTYNGQVYKVGEFSTSGIEAPNSLYLKLIKGTLLSPSVPTWDLMMKNIYAIGAYGVSSENFIMDVAFFDDSEGSYINYFPEGATPEEGGINGELFLSLMELDNLDSNQEPSPDGIFDFVSGYTIMPDEGRIVFPVLEPFGRDLEKKLNGNQELIDKYVFNALYDSTQTYASQLSEKNKFILEGTFEGSSSSEISLNAFNIPEGSVVVTAGGIKLTENEDYTVDYTSGTIRIINEGLLESGTPIQVSLESQDLYNLQTKTLLGTHLNYQFNDNFNVGGTLIHLREKPLTQKVNYGDEPIANTIWGLNTSYYTESNGLTNLIDKLPLVETTTPSSVSFEGEFAQLLPGHPNVIEEAGTSYIDDFEGSETPIDIMNWTAWKLASIPQGQQDLFPEAANINDLSYGFDRAKIAWYVIDPLFLRNNNLTPAHLRKNPDQQSNHFVREVYEKEIFPNRESTYGEPTNISVLNLAYYPDERGPYNFDTNLTRDGKLQNPKERWAGIMREIQTSDFEAANVEYIEFWVMDPFVYNDGTDDGGDLYINLGNISEDILRDSRKFFEQGLPGPNEISNVDSTVWGYIPTEQSLVNAFSNDAATRYSQDVGLNGLSSEQERSFYTSNPHPFIKLINNLHLSGGLTDSAYEAIMNDPAADDYHYYRGSDFDKQEIGILDRYKNFNNPEGNSVPSEYSDESYSTAATTIPDGEDINNDNTLSETESYFQYKISLRPQDMVVGENFITDEIESTVTLKNGKSSSVKWYQFKVPVNNPDTTIGELNDFSSIRFMRLFLKNFSDTTILRFATMDLVRSDWRKYTDDLFEAEDMVSPSVNTEFDVSTVNIEENGSRTPVNYVLPPGIDRVIDPSNTQIRQLNEQSISLKATDLSYGDARAVYKTSNIDIRQYGRIKMEVHAEEVSGYPLEDDEIIAFLRIGTDFKNNYYEYQIPLKVTPSGTYSNNSTSDRYIVWPEENSFDFPIELLQQLKLDRNDELSADDSDITTTDRYESTDPDNPQNHVIIKGNPNLANVKSIMIGIRNNSINNSAAEVWFNEFRLSDFNEDGGWAANARMNVKLADIGSISVAGKVSTAGFGSVDESVTERSQEDFYQYDFATNLELGKLLGPDSRLSAPMYVGVSEEVSTPEYNPLDPDIPMDVALDNASSKAERDSLKNLVQDRTKRKSFNLTNVRIKPKDDNPKLYDISNLSATYSYNETNHHDVNTEYKSNKNFRGILAYNYSKQPKIVEPFKNIIKGDAFRLVRDFNFYLLPSQINYRWELLRNYTETQTRNINNPDFKIPVSVSKNFSWNRYFEMTYNLTKSLKIDFSTTTNAKIDEPEGPVNKDLYKDEYEQWKDSVMKNIMSFGRTTNYQHNINASYRIPINKLPLMDWTSANLNYGALFNWQQGPITDEEYEWGNTIQNSNTIQANGQLNFTGLFNKVPYLKNLSRPQRRASGAQQLRYTSHNLNIKSNEPIEIEHKLDTKDVQVRVFDSNGRPVQGQTKIIDANKITFTTSRNISNARTLITGQKQTSTSPAKIITDNLLKVATSLKNVSISYSANNGTTLPGYLPESGFLGNKDVMGTTAPGIPFILGFQDRDFAMKAVENNWLTTDSTLNSPYIMSHSDNLNIRATFEPINGLRIDLNASRRYSNNMSEYYLYNGNEFQGVFNTSESGSFSTSFNTLATAFEKIKLSGNYESKAFNQFLENRQIIAQRLGQERMGTTYPTTGDYENSAIAGLSYSPTGYPDLGYGIESGVDGYGLTSREVMVPAFLAAYSGKSAENIFTGTFPSLAQLKPNWRINYSGLSNIEFLKKYITSFDVSHAYSSTYTIGNYQTNLEWEDNGDGLNFVRDAQNNFLPKYLITGITITEQFSPFLQFNITWPFNLSTRAEYNKSRILNLSLSNNQLTETYSNEWVIGIGYRFDKMDMILGKSNNQKKISSDLNLSADLSLRENFSIIRKIQEETNQLTAGQKITTLKLTADYVLSDRFNLQLFYDKTINNPYISSSYPTYNTNVGVSFRFSLAQ